MLSGLQSGAQTVSHAGAAAGTVLSAAGAIAPGSALAAAIPIVGPIIAGVTLALGLILSRRGPQQKVATTQVVDDLEPQLEANRDGYLAGRRDPASREAALANFDAAWDYLVQTCGHTELGEPGQRCVNDRKRGGQWDWFAYYRDPIAADGDRVSVDSASVDGGGLDAWLLIGAGAIAMGAML